MNKEIELLQGWLDAFRNNGKTTSLKDWNDGLKQMDSRTREYLYSIAQLPPNKEATSP